MKLSTLYEARDPKKEAELEPKLTAPFYKHEKRATMARQAAQQSFKDYGVPERQFLPNPHGTGTGSIFNPYGPGYQHIRKIGTVNVPTLGYQNLPPAANVTDTGRTMNNAIAYWSKNFNGERWPALEQAFLNRDWTFTGAKGTYNSARTSLFKYLNNLKTSWPEGEKMANQVLSKNRALEYVDLPEIKKYILSRPQIPELKQAIEKHIEDYAARRLKWRTEDLPKYDTDYLAWELKKKAWEDEQRRKAGGELGFHADDEFGAGYAPFPPYKPAEPLWGRGDEAWARKYIQGHTPQKPKPDEAAEFNKKLKEIGDRPPFAGWA